jgi:hypothetical protein
MEVKKRGHDNSRHRWDNAWIGQVSISYDGMDSYVRNAVDGGRQIRPAGRGMDPRVQSLVGLTSIRGIPPTQFVNMYTLGVAELASSFMRLVQ